MNVCRGPKCRESGSYRVFTSKSIGDWPATGWICHLPPTLRTLAGGKEKRALPIQTKALADF